MDAFMGKWKAGPADIDNLEAYANAFQQPQMVKDFERGCDVVVSKEDDNVVVTDYAGVKKIRQVLHPDGKVETETDAFPAELLKLTHRLEDGKGILEGTMDGVETNTSMVVIDGKLIIESSTRGVSMKTTYTKA